MSPFRSLDVSATEIAPGATLKAIGLMSGTSMDGIDAAYLETDGGDVVRTGAAVSVPFSDPFRQRLLQFVARVPERGTDEARALEAELTALHAEVVKRLLHEMGVGASALDVIGFHGQTIWHRPTQRDTWQMGDGPSLARALGVPVVFDFRSDDVHAGGQGAPLLPVYHAALAGNARVAVLNVGGVANMTWIDRASGSLLGFDTGPGNGLIDDWVKARLGLPMDRDGAIAARGQVDEAVLARLLAHPYFAAPAPKSLDRFAFSAAPLASLSTEDGAATLTAFTAASVARGLDLCPVRPSRLLVTGGGRHNPTLMGEIARRAGIEVAPVEDVGWQGDMLEAQGFAYMAVRSLKKLPITFPGTTGVQQPLCGGRLAEP
jgi:anhydro-N-acetylmuramic acid kinase